MQLLGKNQLVAFYQAHTEARSAIEAWVAEVEKSSWRTPKDVKDRYPKASIIKGNQIVFDIKGNKFRIDTGIAFNLGQIIVKRIGTHAEYSKWTF